MEALSENTKAMLTMSVQAGENTRVLSELLSSLHTSRLCFATGEHQSKMVEIIADKVVSAIKNRVNIDKG